MTRVWVCIALSALLHVLFFPDALVALLGEPHQHALTPRKPLKVNVSLKKIVKPKPEVKKLPVAPKIEPKPRPKASPAPRVNPEPKPNVAAKPKPKPKPRPRPRRYPKAQRPTPKAEPSRRPAPKPRPTSSKPVRTASKPKILTSTGTPKPNRPVADNSGQGKAGEVDTDFSLEPPPPEPLPSQPVPQPANRGPAEQDADDEGDGEQTPTVPAPAPPPQPQPPPKPKPTPKPQRVATNVPENLPKAAQAQIIVPDSLRQMKIPAKFRRTKNKISKSVQIRAQVAVDGSAVVRVGRSCGDPEIDEFVREQVETRARFTPNTDENGAPRRGRPARVTIELVVD